MLRGFCCVEVVPSPKSHSHSAGLPVVRSLNSTYNGVHPALTFIEKSAFNCAFRELQNEHNTINSETKHEHLLIKITSIVSDNVSVITNILPQIPR